MIEKEMDLWDAPVGAWIGITTNGVVKADGRLVMGAGVAREARDRFPGLDAELGRLVRQNGNVVVFNWKRSAGRLASCVQSLLRTFAPPSADFYLPRPGCGLGGLRWGDVREAISFLPDNVIIVHKGGLNAQDRR